MTGSRPPERSEHHRFPRTPRGFWKVGGLIHRIQKNKAADHGLGGARSIEKARLYLALEPGKCTIRKTKIFRQKDRNPNGLSIAFKIVGGARFVTDAAGWRREG